MNNKCKKYYFLAGKVIGKTKIRKIKPISSTKSFTYAYDEISLFRKAHCGLGLPVAFWNYISFILVSLISIIVHCFV